jgi:acyl carrier protein
MEEKLLTIMSEVLEVPRSAVSLESSMGNLEGWDSLKHMNLIFVLEESFSVTFTDDEVVNSKDVKSLLRIVGK